MLAMYARFFLSTSALDLGAGNRFLFAFFLLILIRVRLRRGPIRGHIAAIHWSIVEQVDSRLIFFLLVLAARSGRWTRRKVGDCQCSAFSLGALLACPAAFDITAKIIL